MFNLLSRYSWLGTWTSALPRRPVRGRPVLFLEPLESRELLDAGLGATTSTPFITGLYRDLLSRTPQPSETASWGDRLNSGATPLQVALAVGGSTEYRDDLLTNVNQTAIGGTPAPAQLAAWNQQILAGQSDAQLTAALLASDADYLAHGSNPTQWLEGAYSAVLNRMPDAAGLATWQSLLAGGLSRQDVALQLLQSNEAQQLEVRTAYQLLLHRQPDPVGLATWSAHLAHGMTDTSLLATIATSPEYLQLQAQTPSNVASSLLSSTAAPSVDGSAAGDLTLLDSKSPQILLTPSVLSKLRTMASNNTAQWQAFKKRLDDDLNQVISVSYEGDELRLIADYALGYQILYPSDPTTANQYADKAIAILKSGLNDYQKGFWDTRQFLARGDGKTTSFTLPNSDYVASTLNVYLGSVTTKAVVHGKHNGQDAVNYYEKFIKVSNTSDGNTDYKKGTDWNQDGNWGEDMIDWTGAAKQPATGAKYYLTMSSGLSAKITHAYTVSGTTITFKTAPTAGQAVFVEYLYGTHSKDYSTLAYQQTGAGDGGFDSIYIDEGYTARMLGKYIAMGVDWLWAYPGFSTALQKQSTNLLTQWFNYYTTHGYRHTTVESNYGAGAYVSDVFTALALNTRTSGGPAMLSTMLDFRSKTVAVDLTNKTSSLYGGYYPDGWNYGALAAQNIELAGLALLDAGRIPDDSAEQSWAGQVLVQLVTGQPTPKTAYDGGDWYKYPAPFPSPALFEVLGGVMTDPTLRSYDNYILQNYYSNGGATKDVLDLLFRNPNASTSFWSSLPLQDLATGTGILTARSDWTSGTETFVSMEMGNVLQADHQDFTPGQLQLQRGGDDLLINAWAPGEHQGLQKSTFGNTIVVDDNGDGKQNYRWSMGVWYGNPGVVINAYETTSSYVYEYGNYYVAYSKNTDPGDGGSVSYLTRQIVYLKPDYVVVYDRVTTIKASYPKQARWHFLNAPTIKGNQFTVAKGSSKLFGAVFSSASLGLSSGTVKVGGAKIQQLVVQNQKQSANADYITAFQVAPSTTNQMVSTTRVATTDGRMEGVLMDSQVVLFGVNGNVDLTTPVTYSISASGTIKHLLTNLVAGHKYTVTFNGKTLATVTASSQGTASFSTSGSGSITVQS
jgi:hypothetical protein